MYKSQDKLFEERERLALLGENIHAENRDWQGSVDYSDQLQTRSVVTKSAPDHLS